LPTEERAESSVRPSEENAPARTCPDQFVMVGCKQFRTGRRYDKTRKIRVEFRFHGMTNRVFCHGKKVGRNTVNLPLADSHCLSRPGFSHAFNFGRDNTPFQKRAPLRFVMPIRIS
jgi:hypothetical protein